MNGMGRIRVTADFHDDTLEDFVGAALGDDLAKDPASGYAVLAPLARYVAEMLLQAEPSLDPALDD